MPTSAVQPWRPRSQLHHQLAQQPTPVPSAPGSLTTSHPLDSPSFSTRQSIGYDSDRTSTPEAGCATPGTSLANSGRSNHVATLEPFLGSSPETPSRLSSSREGPTTVATVPEASEASSDSVSHPLSASSFASDIVAGLSSGRMSLALHEGSCGGTYWVLNAQSMPVAVFKPAEEEIGQESNPHGNTETDRDEFVPGTGYKREVLAYLLDHDHSASVPLTAEVTINGKVGSLQQFIPTCREAGSYLPGRFPVEDVQRIALFDLRTLNGDRHGGNILVREDSAQPQPSYRLVPIDHSYVVPSGYSDPDFEWMEWPQSRKPFSAALVAYVAALDAEKDSSTVRDVLHDDDAAEVVLVTTLALQVGVSRSYTAREIAQAFRRESLTQPSKLEVLMGECRRSLDQGGAINTAKFKAEVGAQLFPQR